MVYTFYKEASGRWFVDLPDWEGEKDDLEMVCGADTMLDIISEGSMVIFLYISTKYFEFSNKLELIELGAEEGGGYYKLAQYNGITFDLRLWLCDVTKYVFGEIPKNLYFLNYE